MPVPTPPKANLLQVAEKQGPSKSTQKMSKDIKDLTESIKDDKNGVPVEEPKPSAKSPVKKVFRPTDRLTVSPFRENEDMRRLQEKLKKEIDPKKPIKRSPRRRPAANKTTGEK